MLIGHNPSIQELAVALSQQSPKLAGRKFPTGALATFSIEGSWGSLEPSGARLVSFVRPRELG
jgi:phosphohistidine phosphatase SixA